MSARSRFIGVLLGAGIVVTSAGCQTIDGTPVAAESGVGSSTAAPRQRSSTAVSPSPSLTAAPVGRATIQVLGAGPVTLRYRINGAAERTETNVTLPWEKQYDVYDEVETSVSIDGGDQPITCSIVMDGNLVTFTTEPRPTCSFAYYG